MTGSLSVAPRGPVWSLYLLALGDHFTTKAQTVTMEGNCYQLRVQLSAKGKRVVKGRYSDPVRNPYGSKRHKYGETMENCSNQKYHKLKNLWFRITIPYGRKYDKMWLLSSIEHECGFHFQALQSCLWKRYNQVFQSLDLSDLGNDPDLLSANVFFSVNNASATEVVLQIISEYYPQLLSLNLSHNNLTKLTGFAHLFYLTPQLQSLNLSYNKLCKVQDLDLIHNLELRELWLKGNPLHGAVESFSAYYRLITYHFPAIEKLDGRLFKENLYFEQEEPKPLPESKGSFFGSDEIKTYLAKFLHQYFTLYDSGERKTLLPLYHENACCSFSLPNVFYPRICFLRIKEYWKENRNLLRVRRPEVRRQLIKYNRLQVVGFLCNLPNTEHDLPSMTLDVSLQTASIMCFTVEGKFKEVHTSCHKTPFIPFRRTFIIVPAAEDSAQILNDQMVILNTYVSPQETSSGLSPKSAPAICKQSPPPAAGDTAASFSKDTGMKLDWALKCLQDNNWDVQQAMEMFHVLKNRGAIPQEAFEVETAAGDTSG
ncbi:nuclear RNA export factor 1-like isoform X4 [Hyla sarda]|uniref:nuclear RNA export factor 1-like isoform X4 n=1 Tax=Hyla sarda TaxID=327740 RepID=UPI0024C2C544|nr:nuclear RNA export factor 1-like isoform X4 [Hyla sarda]